MRPEKESIAAELKDKVDSAVFVILTDYKGLNMAQTDNLRSKLFEAGARFQVVRNTSLKIAVEDEKLHEGMVGPSAMVYGDGDVVQVAKTLKDFIKENKLPTVKIGSLSGAILSQQDIDDLAGLPSRDALLGQVVGTIAAPLTGMVGVLNQKLCSLVYVLKAIEAKKQEAA